MGSWVPSDPPEHKGKMHTKPEMKYHTCTRHDKFARRMREDDSSAVNMSDTKLGGGIRDFTKTGK